MSTSHLDIVALEAAINFWRNHSPSERHSMKLCPQASALAEIYAVLIIEGRTDCPPLSNWKPAAQEAMLHFLVNGAEASSAGLQPGNSTLLDLPEVLGVEPSIQLSQLGEFKPEFDSAPVQQSVLHAASV